MLENNKKVFVNPTGDNVNNTLQDDLVTYYKHSKKGTHVLRSLRVGRMLKTGELVITKQSENKKKEVPDGK